MANGPEEIATAEMLGRKRASVMPLLALLFVMQQAAFFSAPAPATGHLLRTVDQIKIGGWVVLSAVMLLVLATGGMWLRGWRVRDLLNDEVTRANRADALSMGFYAALVAALLLYVADGWLQVNVREAIHIIVTAGIVPALLRFGMLEKRALG